jgi:O-antigen biosynthesis protein WbqP
MMKRIFDIILASVLTALLSIPLLVVAVLIKLTSKGPVIFWTDRIGANNTIFKMAKFRTMSADAPQIATHLMENHENYTTPIGKFLRKYSFDEIPQLFNIMKSDMTFIGPRPALFNQNDLIELRIKKNIHKLIPGITGWAQVNGRDKLPIPTKVEFDEYYLKNRSFPLDFDIIVMTFIKVIRGEDVRY